MIIEHMAVSHSRTKARAQIVAVTTLRRVPAVETAGYVDIFTACAVDAVALSDRALKKPRIN